MSAKSWEFALSVLIQLWKLVPLTVLATCSLVPAIGSLVSWSFDRRVATRAMRRLAVALSGIVIVVLTSLALFEPWLNDSHPAPESLIALAGILAGAGLLGALTALSLLVTVGKLFPPAPEV